MLTLSPKDVGVMERGRVPEAKMAEFVKNGYLAVAYAHLVSLGNWQRLVNMTLRKADTKSA